MKRPILAALAALFFCALAQAQSGWVGLTASNITGGAQTKIASGQLCVVGTDAKDIALPAFHVGGAGGVVIRKPDCTAITNGAIGAWSVPNSALASPTNVCLRFTVLDASGMEVGRYKCAQTAASNEWCTGSVCNLDAFQPELSPLALKQYGPQGPPGASCSNVAAAWSGGTAYSVGQCALYDSLLYFAVQAGTGHQPDSSPTYWTQISLNASCWNFWSAVKDLRCYAGDLYAKMQACNDDLALAFPGGGGTCDGSGITGSQSGANDASLTQRDLRLVLGAPMVVTTSKSITVPSPTKNVTIEGMLKMGGVATDGQHAGGTVIDYRGNAKAIACGDDADKYQDGCTVQNVAVDLSNALTGNAAVGLYALRPRGGSFRDVRVNGKIGGGNTQKDIVVDGGSTTTDGGSTQGQEFKVEKAYTSNGCAGIELGGAAGVANFTSVKDSHFVGPNSSVPGCIGFNIVNGTVYNSEVTTENVEVNGWERAVIADGSNSHLNFRLEFNRVDVVLGSHAQNNRFRLHRTPQSYPAQTVFTVADAARASNVATITTTVTHDITVGLPVAVTVTGASSFNGTFLVTAVTSTTFSYANTAADVSPGTYSGGTAQVQPYYQPDSYPYNRNSFEGATFSRHIEMLNGNQYFQNITEAPLRFDYVCGLWTGGGGVNEQHCYSRYKDRNGNLVLTFYWKDSAGNFKIHDEVNNLDRFVQWANGGLTLNTVGNSFVGINVDNGSGTAGAVVGDGLGHHKHELDAQGIAHASKFSGYQLVTDTSDPLYGASTYYNDPTCSTGTFTIYPITQTNKYRKCENGAVSDLAPAPGATTWSAYLHNSINSNATWARWTPATAIKIVSVEAVSTLTTPSCSAAMTLRVTDGVTATDYAWSSGASVTTGAISQNYAAGTTLTLQTVSGTCSTAPSNVNVTVTYKPQ